MLTLEATILSRQAKRRECGPCTAGTGLGNKWSICLGVRVGSGGGGFELCRRGGCGH